jgi:serine/threonine-protein kinase
VAIEDVGFERERTFKIETDRIHELEIRGRQGFLSLKVQPWARVLVDGKDMGLTPLPNLKLCEGNHKVLLENPDVGLRYETKTRIEAEQLFELKVNLNEVGKRM